MSGTSVDGSIDAAWLATDGESQITRRGAHSFRYEDAAGRRPVHRLMKCAELTVRAQQGDLTASYLHFPAIAAESLASQMGVPIARGVKEFTELLALIDPHTPPQQALAKLIEHSTDLHAAAVTAAIKALNIPPNTLDYIGYHGQTLYHDPTAHQSLQVGLPQRLAQTLKIPVIFNFRGNDLSHGGQGAPLAPVYHEALARSLRLAPAVILNLGGCANLTVVGDQPGELFALDSGPASILLDRFMSIRSGTSMDLNGETAQKGQVSGPALTALIDRGIVQAGKNYLDLPSPKSLDARDCRLVPELDSLSVEDGAATLTAFTGETVARGAALLASKVKIPTRWIACGGGAYNPSLLAAIAARTSARLGYPITVHTAEAVGLSSQAMEAELFGYLAARSVRGLPLSFPETTGVKAACRGGELFRP